MPAEAQTPAAPFTVRLHARPESATLLRERMHEWLDGRGVSEKETFDVLLAASEAFVNAVEHPQRPTASIVDVEADLHGNELELTVRDYGVWRDEREREEGSLGFPLMRSVMESVEVDPQAEGSWIIMRRPLESIAG